MRQAYQDQLSNVSVRLVQMCERVSGLVGQSTAALLQADLQLAEQVVAADVEIDRDQLEIDEQVLELMALQAPVATELRIVLSALRTTSDLERMGDLAVHVAKIARMRYPEHAVPDSLTETFAAMGATAEAMGLKACEVIRSRDLVAAAELGSDDNEMDHLHRNLLRSLLHGSDTPVERQVEIAVDIALLGRYYERFADHAVEIAANVQYLVTGEMGWTSAPATTSTPTTTTAS